MSENLRTVQVSKLILLLKEYKVAKRNIQWHQDMPKDIYDECMTIYNDSKAGILEELQTMTDNNSGFNLEEIMDSMNFLTDELQRTGKHIHDAVYEQKSTKKDDPELLAMFKTFEFAAWRYQEFDTLRLYVVNQFAKNLGNRTDIDEEYRQELMKQAALQIPDTYYETHKILDEVSFNELVKSVILDRKKAGFSRFKYAGKSELLQKIWPKLNCGLEILKMIDDKSEMTFLDMKEARLELYPYNQELIDQIGEKVDYLSQAETICSLNYLHYVTHLSMAIVEQSLDFVTRFGHISDLNIKELKDAHFFMGYAERCLRMYNLVLANWSVTGGGKPLTGVKEFDSEFYSDKIDEFTGLIDQIGDDPICYKEKKKMDLAVEDERYEDAAGLRDTIKLKHKTYAEEDYVFKPVDIQIALQSEVSWTPNFVWYNPLPE